MATIHLKRPNKTDQFITPTRIFNDVSQKVPFWWAQKSLRPSGQKIVGVVAFSSSNKSTSIYGLKSNSFESARLEWQESVEANKKKAMSPLGERLRRRREAIVASGVPLLDWDGVDKEKSDRRGGYRGE